MFLSLGSTPPHTRFLSLASVGVTVPAGKILTYGWGMQSYSLSFIYAQWTNLHDTLGWPVSVSVPLLKCRSGFVLVTMAPNRNVQISTDGVKFANITAPQGRTVFLTADQVGVFANSWKSFRRHATSHLIFALESSLMAEIFKNLASTTLNGDHDDTTTSISVASAMGFTTGDFRILIDSEIMKVTSVSGTTLTVSRHQEGTAAASHTNGTAVYHVLTAGALDAHDQNDLASYDTYANRPAAGTPGRIFLPTDGIFIERDNGSTWDKFGPIWPMTPPWRQIFQLG